jgi:hypothetical protein
MRDDEISFSLINIDAHSEGGADRNLQDRQRAMILRLL